MSNSKDFYKILGVSASAEPDEIKRAYRRLAIKLHPDRQTTPDKKHEAENEFKTIQEAYTVLSDPQKRQTYDQLGPQGYAQAQQGGGQEGFHPQDFADFFQSTQAFSAFENLHKFFRGGEEMHGSTPSGEPVHLQLRLTLESIAAPQKQQVSYSVRQPCEACRGRGSLNPAQARRCEGCHGQGRVHRREGFYLQTILCPRCQGSGKRFEQPCSACKGSSLKQGKRTLTLELPAGMESGSTFVQRGFGHAGAYGAPAGDLQLTVEILPHDFFQRHGLDLVCELWFPFTLALTGGKVEVPTLGGGQGTLTVPAGVRPQGLLRIRGQGLASGARKGDLICRLQFEWPQGLKSSELEALSALAQSWIEGHDLKKLYPKTSAHFPKAFANLKEPSPPKKPKAPGSRG